MLLLADESVGNFVVDLGAENDDSVTQQTCAQ
jgi:hypothetical protein